MPCPLCGDICRCSSDACSAASPRWLADDDARPAAAPPYAEPQAPEPDAPTSHLQADTPAPSNNDSDQPEPEDSPAWRDEVAARLNRYQARRKPRPPRY